MDRHGRRPSTRDVLLDVAFDLFSEVGFAGTTITEIERRVGLASGTGSFYRHFSSKEELLPVAIQRAVDRAFAAAASSAAAVDDRRGEREKWLHGVLTWLRQTERLTRLLLLDGERVPEVRVAITSAMRDATVGLSWADDPVGVMSVAALNGYLLLSRALGVPFYDIDEEDFIASLATLGF